MDFKINPLYLTDGYKVGHKAMLAPGTTRLYGTWIPRSTKYAPKGITKITSFGQQLVWSYIHDAFQEHFFDKNLSEVDDFVFDMTKYLGLPYDGKHFEELHKLGYLPIRVKSLPEGIETDPNIPHMTFVNTVDGFAWLTLYLETLVSSLAWKPSTSATIARQYRRNAVEWVKKTDPDRMFLVDYLCHDFSARGLNPHDVISSGLGHATCFKGSDSLPVIPAARYYYNVGKNDVVIESVNASEHSVSTTKIFTVGEQQMLSDWMDVFPKGILSVVSDTFDLWKLITEYLPNLKDKIMARDGKLVIRPDSGDPVDIICGAWEENRLSSGNYEKTPKSGFEGKGVIELLWDIFGGTVNEQGYKVLDSHIGAIYGDSITLERQVEIYKRLAEKGFASTNIVLGVGSFTYQYNTRDTFGWAAKGSWFEIEHHDVVNERLGVNPKWRESFSIYKDPVTDDGTKKSLKGMIAVMDSPTEVGKMYVKEECTGEEERQGHLQVIYEDGIFHNQISFNDVRVRINEDC